MIKRMLTIGIVAMAMAFAAGAVVGSRAAVIGVINDRTITSAKRRIKKEEEEIFH